MEYPIDPQTPLFQWGPIPFKLFYGDWDGLFTEFSRRYPGHSWPKALCLFRDGRFLYISSAKEMREKGERAFLELLLPEEERETAKKEWNDVCDALHAQEQKIDSTNLSRVSVESFRDIWCDFHNAIRDMWATGSLPEVSNFGAVDYLEDTLRPLVPNEELPLVMEALTAAEEPSFYQQEEIELVGTADVASHAKKYVWLSNSYDHAEILSLDSFIERKANLTASISDEVATYIAGVRANKNEIRNKYHLSDEIMDIAACIVEAISWQDERKREIWKYIHYKDVLLEEVVRRWTWDKSLLLYMLASEIVELMDGSKSIGEFEWRRRDFGLIYHQSDDRPFIDEETTKKYWDLYTHVEVPHDLLEFSGIIACKGKGPVRGAARIVFDARKAENFTQGDILVTTMTSPEYVWLMRKAAAVVTDTGGLMSHAAVVSREFNVPCIVGTKISTKVLKDGDTVEVDPGKGIVRRIEL